MVSKNSRIRAFGVAFKGLFSLFREFHFKIHITALLTVIVAGFYFHISSAHWVNILLISALVLSLEAVNSAIENLADAVHPDRHPLIGKCKDIAAGAVLIAAIFAVAIAAIIFTPYIVEA
ncbi:MAG: diacylglycerol kinase family protein [Bacteroidetes bacterium]|uniref:Diacylglycerol kinase family protein n=1 Tax=Phaeocystidibacter marisrubri TaxID=1577780 RepID=A0A6L3ZFU7_9FLAO|nr:diacylglycerol kinase family protein [Phaeocystidibacter marisrubri]KAB2815799.1 diacylglycerol kinase family protein [Phaeocystidibacter marisrubri]TNE28534.1 MAG: diacylglycerol kinase family protein [Bacteroidota bacterium]GGH65768.1 diacylglycerol kinase [Phaeocystidibacter marisrubri]